MSRSSINPYAAPQVDRPPPRPPPSGRGVRWTSRALVVLLVLLSVLHTLGIGTAVSLDMQMIELQADLIDEHSADAVLEWFAWHNYFAGLRRLAWLLIAPAWWLWTVRCNQLVRGHGLEPRRRPIGTVLWWFVPLANLVVPVRVIAELWQASQRPEPIVWREVPVSWVIPAWWASFWLMLGIRVFVLVRTFRLFAEFDADLTPATLQVARLTLRADMLQHAVSIVAGALAIALVVRISAGLTRSSRS